MQFTFVIMQSLKPYKIRHLMKCYKIRPVTFVTGRLQFQIQMQLLLSIIKSPIVDFISPILIGHCINKFLMIANDCIMTIVTYKIIEIIYDFIGRCNFKIFAARWAGDQAHNLVPSIENDFTILANGGKFKNRRTASV